MCLMGKKRILGLVVAVIIMILTAIISPPAGLTVAGKNALGLLISGVVLWITESIPLAISAMLLMILLPVFGITSLSNVYKDFMSSAIFFIIATFGLTTAISNTNFSVRLTGKIMKWSGNSPKKIVLGFIACTALLSTVMTNTAVCALWMAMGLAALKCTGAKPGESNLGRCLMIGIPFAAFIGGYATPAGVSINMMAIGLLEQAANIKISFLQWMIVGIPLTIIMIPVCWWSLVTIFKPEPIKQEDMAEIMKNVNELGPMSTKEKKIVILILAMLVLWICNTWVPALDTSMVAIAGLVVMFLPGIDLLTWDDFVKGVSWNIILLIGGVQALATGILKTGAGIWIVKSTMAGAGSWGDTITNLAASVLMTILHMIIPVGPAIVGMSTAPIVSLAPIAGTSAGGLTIMVAIMSATAFLLPIDCVPLITYSKGYYSFTDYIKAGVFPTIILILYCGLILPHLARLVGLM